MFTASKSFARDSTRGDQKRDMPSGMLTAKELKKRIHAARILRGVHQKDLQKSLAADGLGKQELGRIERGDLTLTKVRREVLSKALSVPEQWFLNESVDEIVGFSPPQSAGGLPQPPGELGRELKAEPPTAPDPARKANPEEEDDLQGNGG